MTDGRLYQFRHHGEISHPEVEGLLDLHDARVLRVGAALREGLDLPTLDVLVERLSGIAGAATNRNSDAAVEAVELCA